MRVIWRRLEGSHEACVVVIVYFPRLPGLLARDNVWPRNNAEFRVALDKGVRLDIPHGKLLLCFGLDLDLALLCSVEYYVSVEFGVANVIFFETIRTELEQSGFGDALVRGDWKHKYYVKCVFIDVDATEEVLVELACL